VIESAVNFVYCGAYVHIYGGGHLLSTIVPLKTWSLNKLLFGRFEQIVVQQLCREFDLPQDCWITFFIFIFDRMKFKLSVRAVGEKNETWRAKNQKYAL
jgi:hypothetical protein